MPLLLYPMLGLGLRFLAFQESSDAQVEYRLAIPSEAEAVWLSETLKLGERLLEASEKGPDPLRRGQETNKKDSPPKGQTPFRIATNQQPAPDVQLLVPNDPLEFDLEGLVQNSAADLGIKVVSLKPRKLAW
jgi:hypothetical protein